MAKKEYPNVEGILQTLIHQLVYELQSELLDPTLRMLREVVKNSEAKLERDRENYKTSSQVYVEKADALRGRIKDLALEGKQTFAPERGVTIKFTKGYCKITYDSKELDRLLAKNPALAEMVNPARKEKDVDPRVSIVEKVDEPELGSAGPVIDTATAGSIDDPPF